MIKCFALLVLFNFISCGRTNNKAKESNKDTATTILPPKYKEKQAQKEEEAKPVINVEPVIIRPQIYLAMRDTTNFEEEAHVKLKLIFNNLSFILQKNHLQEVGSPAAWHGRKPNLFIEEGGVLLGKKLPYHEPGTFYKETKTCAGALAHFFGKRSLLFQAYDSLNAWVKENNKTAVSAPWEVYVSDPRTMKDVNYLQTDIFIEVR